MTVMSTDLDAGRAVLAATPPITLLSRALRSALYGLAIGAALAFLYGQSLWGTVVYSVCVAILCWACIETLMRLVAQWRLAGSGRPYVEESDRWPGWPWMVPIIVVSSVIAYTGGSWLGDRITGAQSPDLFGMGARDALKSLVFCIVPAVAITHFFYTRGTLANREAEVAAARQLATESRLRLLESQLEPHMLFNTLANLRVLIALDPPRAQAMLDRLIAFLRATLDGSRALEHPLGEEFARLQDYLALMQVRMMDRLQTRFELPGELASVPVPPLLLQPLVENCVKHGLEPAVRGGSVEIRAAHEDGILLLSVRDTGVGLPAAAHAEQGFGLHQVRERLATLYGTRAALTIERAGDERGGTLATIRLPLAAAAAPSTPSSAPPYIPQARTR